MIVLEDMTHNTAITFYKNCKLAFALQIKQNEQVLCPRLDEAILDDRSNAR